MTPGMKKIAPALRGMRDEGISQCEAARRLGVSKSLVNNCARAMGLEWTCGSLYGVRKRWERDAIRRVQVGRDEYVPLAEAARQRGLPVGTVHERWNQGDRTAKRLLRPLNAYHDYQLGLSMAEWGHILAYADARGRSAAGQKFCVPVGAIRLMQEGHQEWVA